MEQIQNLFLPVPNYCPPSTGQVETILASVGQTVMERRKRAFVHCGGGKSHAGTVATCILLKWGFNGAVAEVKRVEWEDFHESSEVIRLLRSKRPGSIETDAQETIVRHCAQELWKNIGSVAEHGVDDARVRERPLKTHATQNYPSTPYLPFLSFGGRERLTHTLAPGTIPSIQCTAKA